MTDGTIKLNDLSKVAEPYLTEKAKVALAKPKCTSLLRVEGGVLTHQCVYYGKKVKLSEIESAVKIVSEKINDLAEKDLIEAPLSHFVKFDLSPESTGYFNQDGSPRELETVVLCYVRVPQATYEEIMKDVKKNHIVIDEKGNSIV